MDVSIAKTLVSMTLVVGITIFSLFSFELFFSKIVQDLRAVRAQRSPEADGSRSK